MSFTKNLGSDLTSSLLEGDSFLYAHLVKFENVATTAGGQIQEQASDYSYVTDASFDIKFNDLSKTIAGSSNGTQVYSAARVSKVSNITETTEAKVSNVTLQISSVGLSTAFVGSATNRITVSDSNTAGCKIRIIDTGNGSWTDLGFSEGDKIEIASGSGNSGRTAVISRFENDNFSAICIHPSGKIPFTFGNETNAADYTISLVTDQVTAILNDPALTTYNGYINREVSVFKAHISPDTGTIIGVPYLLFKGIISKAKLVDDPTKNSTVTWTLTSHWGDFIRVNGRMTADSEHRALGTNGQPDLGALFRDDYAHDFGFKHAEQAVNIMAVYQVMETRYKLKKSGFIFKKYKQVEYQVEVDREVDLRINLEAKRLPLIYGVQRTDSIPIFADSLHSDPAKIYVAYAICEGEVSGLYDIYVDDQSRICVDKNDSDVRDVPNGEGTIEVVCEGRMDRGDTLSSSASISAAASRGMGRALNSFDFFGGGMYSHGNFFDYLYYAPNLAGSALNVNGATGITHEKQTTLEHPIKSKIIFHSGRSHQRADDQLTTIAQNGAATTANGFKLQASTEDPKTYWTSNHRLLDTAYIVAEFDIAEGDVTIPTLDFVVRGKEIEQYNYDYSYVAHPNPSFSSGTITDKRALFKIGDTVDFYKLSDNSALTQDVQIVDASTYISARNETVHKFRFSKDPVTTTGTTAFFMVQNGVATSSDSKYPMITWDYKGHSGTVPAALTQEVSTIPNDTKATAANTTVSGGTGVDIKELLADIQAALTAFGSSSTIGFVLDGQSILDGIATFLQRQSDSTVVGGERIEPNVADTQVDKDKIKIVSLLNVIKLAASASSVNDYYKGQIVTVINTDSTTGTQKRQSREIIKYNGATRHALVGSLIDVATTASQVPGTFISASRGAGLTTINFTDASSTGNELSVDQIIRAANSETASIPQGTKITGRNNNTITVDKPCNIGFGASIIANTPGGADETTEHPEPFDFVPQQGDLYEIAALGDKKVSINPAIQLLDYLTNGRYGRGLALRTVDGSDEKDISLETFKQSARICDTRADVSVILPTAGTYTLGDKWRLVSTVSSVDYLQWEGTILSVINAGTGYKQVTFTDCIGKLAHKWFDWKSYDIGNILYHQVRVDASNNELAESLWRNKVYKVDVAGTISKPFASNMPELKIQRSTNASTEAAIYGVSSAGETTSNSGEEENPIVKAYNGGSYSKSGYSMYDSDDVKYWRYLGWQEHNQREVTRHQTNALIRTDSPLFDNVNSMLKHFNGILRYSLGKYELDVESTSPTISASPSLSVTTSSSFEGSVGPSNTQNYTDPRIITQDDIIGAINVDDAGLKGSANSVSVTIADPNIRYDNLSVNFFKSDYLKEDRNIPKKKDVKTPLITNYYNARINAEQYLDQSRFSRKINFVIGPKGVLLLAGNIIKLYYERFGWEGKEFRISNLSYRPDCSVQITAEEHSDDTYLVTAKEKTFQGAEPSSPPGDEEAPPRAPRALTATGSKNLIALEWENSINFGRGVGGATWRTEIWYNNHATFTNATANTVFSAGAVRLNTLSSDERVWEHILPSIDADTTFYYWIRHIKQIPKPVTQIASAYFPTNVSNGISGTAEATPFTKVADMFLFKLSNAAASLPNSNFPTLVVSLLEGSTYGTITGVVASGSAAITNGQIIDTTGAATGWFTAQQSVSASNKFLYRVYKRVSTTNNSINIAKADWGPSILQNSFGVVGGDGAAGDSGIRSSSFIIYHTSPSASTPGNPSATLYTFGAAAPFTNLSSGWSTTAPSATAGTSSSNYWYATVNVQEGKNAAGVSTGTAAGASYSTANGQLLISVAYIGLAFTGLVTFNALSANGTTTIHGGNISTGTILANRIVLSGINTNALTNGAGFTDDTKANEAFNLAGGKNKTFYQNDAPTSGMIVGDLWVDQNATDVNNKYYRRGASTWVAINPSTVGGWNLTATSLFSGNVVNAANAGFTSGAGHISINSGGSIHTPKFFVNQQGNAGFSGVLTFTDGTMDLGSVAKATITNSAITLSDVSSNLSDVNPAGQVSSGFSTTITAGTMVLQSSSVSPSNASNRIELNAGTNQIIIKDAGVNRVIIGKL